jgi:hypothetical protein
MRKFRKGSIRFSGSHENAIEQITFPHIKVMIQQIAENPQHIWGGILLQYQENETWKSKILEEFYPL